jgi:hypothetical protein
MAISSRNGVKKPTSKTICPVTREQFRALAGPIAVQVAGQPLAGEVKEFSSGSLGWYAGGKVVLEVGGKRVVCQLSLSVVIANSKELPAE